MQVSLNFEIGLILNSKVLLIYFTSLVAFISHSPAGVSTLVLKTASAN